MKLKINPELEKLERPLNPEEYEGLKSSIKEKGLEKMIDVMSDGTIIDGNHRYKIMKELGKEIPEDRIQVHSEIDSIEKAREFICDSELHRHLNPFERCELIYKGYYESVVNSQQKGRVDEILGKKAQVSQQTFSRAKKIIETDNDLLKKELREGKLSINKAYAELKISQDIKSKTWDLAFILRGLAPEMQLVVSHGKVLAYATRKGIYCCGCGLLLDTEKDFQDHISRVVQKTKKNIAFHFEEWFKESISRDSEYGEEWNFERSERKSLEEQLIYCPLCHEANLPSAKFCCYCKEPLKEE